jgi:flagellar motor switch protein FliG
MAANPKDDYRKLTGPQKTAILMMSIGEENASKLFGKMDDEEIREISSIMATLGEVSPETVERLYIEFAEQMSASGAVVGTYDTAEKLLIKALGKDRVDSIMEDIRGPAGKTTWDKLGNVSEEVLAGYLKNEYPQTIALVLSKIKSDHASRVLAVLPQDLGLEVIMRMLTMETVRKEVLEGIEKTLRMEFMSNLAKTQKRDSHEMMADIFNNFDRNTESRFMKVLEERDKDTADKIRSFMFTFEDLKKINGAGIQAIIRVVDKDKLTIALKGASDTIKSLFFDNMSERAAKIMREDMEAKGPVRLKDVDEAQMVVVTTAKDLADKGEITVAGNDEDQMVG